LKKKEWGFAVVQTLLVVAVLLLVSLPLQSVNESGRTSSSLSSPSPPASCGDQLEVWGPAYGWENSSLVVPVIPVLLMQPNTTGYICVTYQSVSGSSPANANPLNGVWDVRYSKCNANVCVTNVESHSFVVGKSVLNSSLPFVSNATVRYVSVIYSLTALGNSTGFYEHSAPLGYCNQMPLAVGRSASQLSASDFPDFYMSDCIMSQYAPIEVGVIGMQVANVEFPNLYG